MTAQQTPPAELRQLVDRKLSGRLTEADAFRLGRYDGYHQIADTAQTSGPESEKAYRRGHLTGLTAALTETAANR